VKTSRFWILAAMCCGVLAGCATPQPARFYTLGSAPAEARPANTLGPVVIGPVNLPAAVDRPQLVVQRGDHEVQILEHQRWAAPLKQEIPRLIAERIEAATGRRVVVYPEPSASPPAFTIHLTVVRFDTNPAQGVTVETTWDIKTVNSGTIHSGQSVQSEVIVSEEYGLFVGAHAQALTRIGDEIAATLQSLAAAAR
jgi:uncharacterized protein